MCVRACVRVCGVQAIHNLLTLSATSAEIDELFQRFDADGSGTLDLGELKCAPMPAGEPQLRVRVEASRSCRARSSHIRAISEPCRTLVCRLAGTRARGLRVELWVSLCP